jgi:DNA-binding transcriptional LysR family regulator
VSFFSDMFEELGARRRRLHTALGALAGGLVEFALIGGLTLGLGAALLGKPVGVAPLIGFVLGYGLLEQRRQRALAGGAEEGAVRRRGDRHALIVSAAMAVLGFWVFGQAMAAKEQAGWVEPEPPPPRVFDLEIVK